MNEILLRDNVPVTEQDLGLYEGLIRADIEEVDTLPVLHWKGGKITRELWDYFKSFMRYGYEEFSSEIQVWFYYHEQEAIWQIMVPPQTIRTGMASNVLKNHADFDLATQWVRPEEGWSENGTGHQHCSASAFMSSTDEADETKKIGLHITLGSMNASSFDLHCRAGLRGLIYEVDLAEWVEGVEDLDFLSSVPITLFPEHWTEFLHEPVRQLPTAYLPKPQKCVTGFPTSTTYQRSSDYYYSLYDVPNYDIVDSDVDVDLEKAIDLATFLENSQLCPDWMDNGCASFDVVRAMNTLLPILNEMNTLEPFMEALLTAQEGWTDELPDSFCLWELRKALADKSVVPVDFDYNKLEEEEYFYGFPPDELPLA